MPKYGFALSDGEELTIVRSEEIFPDNRLFGPIADFLVILSAIVHTATYMTTGASIGHALPTFVINALRANLAFVVPLRGPFEFSLRGESPTSIQIGILAASTDLKDETFATEGLNQILHRVIVPIYLIFFERYNDWLTQSLGDGINWPPTLNFARVVRNAAAHGKINIRNPNSPAVTWNGLSYSYSDNGRIIIGADLRLGDVLALMFEIDKELEKLKTPVL